MLKQLNMSIALCLLLGLSACQREQVQQLKVEEEGAATNEKAELEAIASKLNLKAYTEETKVTAKLQSIATQFKAQLQGLEHRLKTKSSTLRKLQKLHHDAPQLLFSELKISDALRYTFEVKDEPKGHYVKTVQATLKSLEESGYNITKVKNYWPKGDNYSGVNTIISTQDGFEWELQFHTPASYQEAKKSHEKYEKLRALTTPLAERQSLFSAMAEPWNTIEVPQDVLTPKNLHVSEEIKKWDAPIH